MGYETWMSFSIELRKGITKKEFEDKLANEIKKQGEGSEISNWKDMSVKKRYIEVDEGYTSHDYEELEGLFQFLAPIVKKGFIYGDGQDTDDNWIAEFDGQGNHEIKYGEIVYNNPYKVFIDSYRKKLPEKLLNDLKAWRTIQKL